MPGGNIFRVAESVPVAPMLPAASVMLADTVMVASSAGLGNVVVTKPLPISAVVKTMLRVMP